MSQSQQESQQSQQTPTKKDNIVQEMILGHPGCAKLSNSDYGTVAYYMPKNLFEQNHNFDVEELKFNSIYFLIGYEQGESGGVVEKMYVGKAGIRNNGNSVVQRLSEHLTNTNESYYNKWEHIVVVTNASGSWGSTEIAALEYLFWSFIPVGNRYNSQLPSSNGADLRLYTDRVAQIKAYISKIGFGMFEADTEEITEKQVEQIADAKSDLPVDLNTGTYSIPDITTPKRVVKEMVDSFPVEWFDNPNIVFLDPACKGGELLKEVYDRFLKSKKHGSYFKSDLKQKMHILKNQLFGIALTPTSLALTDDLLEECPNIKIIPNYVSTLKAIYRRNSSKSKSMLEDMFREAFGREMKFNVVLGNPPYQGEDGRSSIYPYFVNIGLNLADTVCMITRDNWLNGKAFKDMRNTMLEKGQVEKIVHYPVVGELFNTIGVSVAYFVWNRGNSADTGASANTAYKQIVKDKIVSDRLVNIDCIISSDIAQSIFNKAGRKGEWLGRFNTRSYPFMDQRKRIEKIDTSVISDDYYNVAVLANNEPVVYTNINEFANTDEVQRYKVICGVIINEATVAKPGNVLTNIKAIEPNVVSSETWSLLATFDNEEETVNCKKYIQTKFTRFIANLSVNNRSGVTDNTFQFVPLQDFTTSSDIDWSQSIADIDQQLYKKYNLTEEEINYIEHTIKPMSGASTPASQSQPSKQKLKVTTSDLEANRVNQLVQANNTNP